MTYFTILHWLVLAIVSLFFILITILVLRNQQEKSPVSTLIVMFVLMVMVFVISIFGLDEYTKVARLENVSHQKVLINESLVYSGQIRNIGGFTIGKCKLEVEIFSDRVGEAGSTALFTPKSIFGDFFTNTKENDENAPVSKTFVIAENLKKGELRNFSVSMRFPTGLKKPTIRHELTCR